MKLVYKHDFGVYMWAYIIEKQCEESIMRRSNKARGKGRGIKRNK